VNGSGFPNLQSAHLEPARELVGMGFPHAGHLATAFDFEFLLLAFGIWFWLSSIRFGVLRKT